MAYYQLHYPLYPLPPDFGTCITFIGGITIKVKWQVPPHLLHQHHQQRRLSYQDISLRTQ